MTVRTRIRGGVFTEWGQLFASTALAGALALAGSSGLHKIGEPRRLEWKVGSALVATCSVIALMGGTGSPQRDPRTLSSDEERNFKGVLEMDFDDLLFHVYLASASKRSAASAKNRGRAGNQPTYPITRFRLELRLDLDRFKTEKLRLSPNVRIPRQTLVDLLSGDYLAELGRRYQLEAKLLRVYRRNPVRSPSV